MQVCSYPGMQLYICRFDQVCGYNYAYIINSMYICIIVALVLDFNIFFAVIFEIESETVSIRSEWFRSEFKLYGLYMWTDSTPQVDGEGFAFHVCPCIHSHAYHSKRHFL